MLTDNIEYFYRKRKTCFIWGNIAACTGTNTRSNTAKRCSYVNETFSGNANVLHLIYMLYYKIILSENNLNLTLYQLERHTYRKVVVMWLKNVTSFRDWQYDRPSIMLRPWLLGQRYLFSQTINLIEFHIYVKHR
jgi:hypothetical protein